MRGVVSITVCCLLLGSISGCSGPSRRTLASTEPALVPSDPEVAIIDRAKPVPGSDSVVDRHPLLSKPRDYYDNTASNKVVKTAAATFIGVPAGILGEIRQIVVGVPRTSVTY